MARPANPDLRAEILKAATGAVERRGPASVTMREVAEQVGYSPTTLYLYFKDKDAILSGVVLEGFDDLAEFSNAAMVGPTLVDKFRQRGRAYVMWGATHPSLYQLVFETTLGVDWTTGDGIRMTRALTDGVALLQQAVDEGELSATLDARRRMMIIWAALHGVTSLAISRRLRTGGTVMEPSEVLDLATALGDEAVNDLLAPYLASASGALS
jgi:AcrR family transcriptional regulator